MLTQPHPAQASRIKRGLVLQGGGAKGAHTFGVIAELARQGIDFSAVSGTSAGALNALLVATQSYEEGGQLWENLTLRGTFLPRRRAWLVMFVMVFRIISAYGRGVLSPVNASGATVWLGALTVGVLLLGIASPLAVVYGFFTGQWIFKLAWFTLAAFILSVFWAYVGVVGLFAIVTRREHVRNAWEPLAVAFMAAFMVMVLFAVMSLVQSVGLDHLFQGPSEHGLWWYLYLFLFQIPCVLLCVFMVCLPCALAWSYAHEYSALRNDPLREKLAPFVDRAFHVPCYACCASVDQLDSFLSPHYFKIHDLSADEAVNILLASAALPLGLAPHVDFKGIRLVDGGVVDNVPLLPLVDREECDEIWIVYTGTQSTRPFRDQRSRLSSLRKAIQHRAGIIARRRRDGLLGATPAMGAEQSFPSAAEMDRRQLPRLIHVSPSRPLGGLIFGTLRFKREFAQWAMELGRSDANRALEWYRSQQVPQGGHRPPSPPRRYSTPMSEYRRMFQPGGTLS